VADASAVTPHPDDTRPGFRALMRNRNYALLWTGQLVSEMGNRFHWIAVSLWVYSLTSSASAVSMAVASMFAGSLIVSLWAGVFVDRFDRRKILIASDLARALLVLAIPSLIQVNLWLLYLDLILISVATAFFRPAIFAVIPTTVVRPQLMAANSFFSAMDTGTEMAGPLLAGVLAERLGYSALLYFDGFTYLFSGLCIALTVLTPMPQRRVENLSAASIWKGVTEGLSYIRRDALQWGLFVLIFPATLVGTGLNALQTPLAKGAVGITDAQFGTFNSVWGFGFLAASLLLGWYGSVVGRGLLVLSGYFLGFLATALMALSQNFPHLLLTAFVVGFSNTMYYVGVGTVLMEHTPSTLIGRVISTRQLALGLVRVVSPLFFGAVAEEVGIRSSVILMALVGAAGTTAVIVWLPVVRSLGGRSQGQARPSAMWAWTFGSVDPDIEVGPQYRMNAVSLFSVLAVLVFLGFHIGRSIFVVAVALGLFAYFGILAKRRWGSGQGS
jgi:MFS family permease